MISKRAFCGVVLGCCLAAGGAGAVDLDTNAIVSIVDGITIAEATALNFGEIALNDGTVTVNTDGSVTDPSFISYDATSLSQGTFSVMAVAGGAYNISIVENGPVVGLTLDNFHINIDGGADEAGADNFVAVTLANQTSAVNVGADLTVDGATASIGLNQMIGYRVTVEFN